MTDNGFEFSQFSSLEIIPDTKDFFVDPYSFFEKGENERHRRNSVSVETSWFILIN